MGRDFFMKTARIGFSKWEEKDIGFAEQLWGNPVVTKYICASGIFRDKDIVSRFNKEITNDKNFGIQYWPIFEIETENYMWCCGLRPYKAKQLEIGFHLCPEFWGKGFASEAAQAVIKYAFHDLKTKKLFSVHNPNNLASKNLLKKLGFTYTKEEFYEPTRLYHPSYELESH